MSPNPVLLATAAVLAFGLALPAEAGLFGKKKRASTDAATAVAQPPAPQRASRELRAQAERLDPLARAAFWTAEVAADPTDLEAAVRLSAALRAMGRWEEAVAAAERIAIQKPDAVEPQLEIARAHLGRGQGFYALEPLRKAAALAPGDWRPRSLLGVAYDQTDRPQDARAAWTAALKLSPENTAVLTNLGMSYAASGEREQAIDHLQRAAARPDATPQTRLNLALVLGLAGRAEEAERLIRDQLPPQEAEANLAWLRRAAAGPTPATTRSWDALKAATP
jgi:Flp pilus assembly protein TadD